MPNKGLHIFSFLNIEDLGRSQIVSRQWRTLASHKSLWDPTIYFGPEKWIQYFREIEILQRPKNIIKALNSPCPIWPGKKIKDTHILMLIPKSINGEEEILAGFSRLIKRSLKNEYGNGMNISIDPLLLNILRKHHQSQPSHWVLMTKDVIPGSTNKTYDEQEILVKKLAQESNAPYEIPTALDALICIYMYFVNCGIRLFNDDPKNYTRCQIINKNSADELNVVIGNFSLDHLDVRSILPFLKHSDIGAAVLRKLE